MRHLQLVGGLILLLSSSMAFSEEQGLNGYSARFGSGPTGTFSLKKSFMEGSRLTPYMVAGISAQQLNNQNANFGSSQKGSSGYRNYATAIGARYMLTQGSYSDFLQLQLTRQFAKSSDNYEYSDGSPSYSYTTISRRTYLDASYGLEYFFTAHVSIEATVGLSFFYLKSSASTTESTIKGINVPVVSTTISYCW